jgi:hypothetical protein
MFNEADVLKSAFKQPNKAPVALPNEPFNEPLPAAGKEAV